MGISEQMMSVSISQAFNAYNHDLANGMKALFPMLDGSLPKTKQDELHSRTGDNQNAGISEFMDEETQGHNEDEDQEETDSQTDEDFTETLVFNRI